MPKTSRHSIRVFGAIAACVVAAHLLLLTGWQARLALPAAPDGNGSPAVLSFVTRNIAPLPARPNGTQDDARHFSAQPLRPVEAAPRQKPAMVTANVSPNTNAPLIPSAVRSALPESQNERPAVALAQALPLAESAAPSSQVAPTRGAAPPALEKPPLPPSAVAANQLLATAKPPESVRIEFDGRGKERGFISYSGSAELSWSRDGDRYDAKLDISALGIRLVTWTSKGQLGAAGLMPTRFGDRRRGPEVAAHFQRDKGLISFSTNRPDVPLQAGAQDKLSSLLQLSALVSAAPAQFASGGQVVFQAADAYRAELWAFQVGAPESLDLPGGTLSAIPFVKMPTVEFDQKIEVWLAPDQAYLPVRLRITEPNGTYSDLLWKRTIRPQ